jgi:acetylornithine deacetylase/succinyl-diaminopimelate desuccinylase-like protein
LKEVGGNGATLRSELARQGYLGETPASYRANPMSAHFELHIEQGPILEMEKQKIGIVNGVQAYKWYTIEVEGRGKSCRLN